MRSLRMNQALAQKVGELQRYRSEFFGRVREVLGDRDDIRVVGDRFVFSSEVLFQPAQAHLSGKGEDEITKVAPKRGRGRPPKDKTDTNLGAVNEEQKEVGDEPVVKQAKKKPQESRKVSKISIEFCKS